MKEYKEYKGKLDGTGKKFALIVSRFNEFIAHELLAGALDCLERHNVNDIEIFWTAGAFEIPALAKRIADLSRFDGIICLGAVIRGDTPHFDYIAAEAARGVAKVYYKTGIPTIFGIITADTIEQAIERAGTKAGNKGWDAALSALELVNLHAQLK
jgi:6,7-dimethyl-8-ribityllumazine synthase